LKVTNQSSKFSPDGKAQTAMIISSTGQFPTFLKDLLACPPSHGDGVHQWLFKISRQLHAHRDENSIFNLLAAATSDCGRYVSEKEIRDAIESSRTCAWMPTRGSKITRPKPRPKWPTVATDNIEALGDEEPNALLKLQKSSPVTISSENHDTECILERLFPGNPLVCVANGVSKSIVAPRKELPPLGSFTHVVPSPMSKNKGVNKQGKPSVRCLDNTGRRTYLIAEFDQGTHDKQSAVIMHLATLAPLTMVVDSGGKSLHSWFHCADQNEEQIRKFFSYAVSLGADPATWTKCQLVRIPLGRRSDTGRRQEVVFFNYGTAAAVKEGGSHE
jgi:hypothetical protein